MTGRPTSDHRARLEREPWRAWYGLARWKRRAAGQLAEQPICQQCLKRGLVVPARVAHHVQAHKGDPILFWEGKLESVCTPCHEGPLKAEERSGRVVQSIGADGWPI